jgi:hypothetical protein
MATSYGGPVYTSVSQVTGPTGWYPIRLSSGTAMVYINQDYDGGGWVLAAANRINTGGMTNLDYYDAVNSCNYRNSQNQVQVTTSTSLNDVNGFVGVAYWQELAGRVTSNRITVVQYVATSIVGLNVTASHTKRYRWRGSFSNATYTFGTPTFNWANVEAISDETGTGSPGFYNYHAANGFALTTFDNDHDTNGGNCATYYSNQGFWYGGCWSGNIWGGGPSNYYADAYYWDSSGGDYHNYGAVYIK